MKLTVGSYDIDIKVKNTWDEGYSDYITLCLLNTISLRYDELASKETSKLIAENFKHIAKELFEFCKENGAYD